VITGPRSGDRPTPDRPTPDRPAADRPAADVPPPARPGGSRYGWFVALLVVLILGYITLNTATTGGPGSRGLSVGAKLPPFAVPLAAGQLSGDADVATAPNQGAAGRRPACAVRGPQILNVCELYERGPVALAFVLSQGGHCERILDRMAQLHPAFPRVQMAGVVVRGSRGDARALVLGHRWPFPVGYDRDGALANVYRVAVCPVLTLARRGGVVSDTAIGQLGAAQLAARLRALG
jgi:hypothetical protein